MAGDNFTANGLAFSPDNCTAALVEYPEHRIDRFDFDVTTATHEPPTVGNFRPRGGLWASPTVVPELMAPWQAVEGNHWVAMW